MKIKHQKLNDSLSDRIKELTQELGLFKPHKKMVMQKKNNNDYGFKEVLLKLKSKVQGVDPNSPSDTIKDIENEIDVLIVADKRRTKILYILVYTVVMLLIGMMGLLLSKFDDDNYKSELERRLDFQIKSSDIKDSMLNTYNKIDKSSWKLYEKESSRNKNYRDEINSVREELLDYKNKYFEMKSDFDFVKSEFEITVRKKKEGNEYYTYIKSKKLADCYDKIGVSQFVRKLKPIDSLKVPVHPRNNK